MTRAANGSGSSGAAREQTESRFGSILGALVARVPGVRAAALVDSLGETVDYAGAVDAFSIRLAAAHLRIVLEDVRGQSFFSRPTSISVRTARSGYAVVVLPEGYAIALLLTHRARIMTHARAVSAISGLLAEEGGWPTHEGRQWYAVDILCDYTGRPQCLQARSRLHPIDVLGHYEAGLGWRQRGWRVRFPSGLEAMLVREPGGHWYADEAPPAELLASPHERR